MESFETLEAFLPPVLRKAAGDNFKYALETKNGQQFVFASVTPIDENWIHLDPLEDGCGEPHPAFYCGPVRPTAYIVKDRGIDIRLDSIVWVADGNS